MNEDIQHLVHICDTLLSRAHLVPCKDGGIDASDEEVREGKAMDGGKWRVESAVDGWIADLRETVERVKSL